MSLIELRKALQAESLVFGTKATLTGLKRGKVKKVFLAKNCPKSVAENIAHYASMSGAEIIQMQQPNDELAVICKRGHPISVLSY